MSKQMSNNALLTLVGTAVLIGIVGVFLAVSKVPGIPLTGQQTGTDTGETLFTLQQVASLVFAIDTINWSTGFINTTGGNTICVLDSEGTNDESQCNNFTTVTQGFVLENDGTINLSVTLVSDKNATDFITGTDPVFTWKIRENETNSCSNLSNTTSPATYAGIATTPVTICAVPSGSTQGGMNFLDNNDSLLIDLNITIPADATGGDKIATLTATGTAV